MTESIRNVLIFDYDGTLTLDHSSKIPRQTKDALQSVRADNLATLGIISGRDLAFLRSVNKELAQVFSFLVAENGAISYFIDREEAIYLGKDWSIKARAVFAKSGLPIRFGEVICATERQFLESVTNLMKREKLEGKLVPNKGSLMILPPGVDKGTGVASAMEHLGPTSRYYLTCFGDGENDIALFSPADLRVAVSNSVPDLKAIADVVTENPGGLGVAEYLEETFLIESNEGQSRETKEEDE